MFISNANPNSLYEEDAESIANRYGLTLDDMRADFKQANEYGQQIIRPNPNIPSHVGRYNDACFLFTSYCRQEARENICASQEAERNEDRAFGPMDD